MMNTANNVCLTDADIVRLWDQAVGQGEEVALREHITNCASCRRRWEEHCRDADSVAQLLRDARSAPPAPTKECLSDEQVSQYVGGALTPEAAKAIDEHLATCRECAAMVRSARFFCWEAQQEAAKYESAPIAGTVLRLLGSSSSAQDALRSLRLGPPDRQFLFDQPVRLQGLMPKAQSAVRLAADTGQGLSEQTFHQDDPPMDINLMQFGRELRIEVSVPGTGSPYANCLAELRLLEGQQCRLSRIILIHGGQGRCIIEPSSAQHARPDNQNVKLAVQPLVTEAQLAAAGQAAFVPILERLVEHDDADVRNSVVEVLGMIKSPEALSVVRRACQDADPKVRSSAQAILDSAEGRG